MGKTVIKMKYKSTDNLQTLVDAIKMCIDNPYRLTENDCYIWIIE